MGIVQTASPPAALIFRLGVDLPAELDRLALAETMGVAPAPRHIAFRFAYREVVFAAQVEPRGEEAVLGLVGDLGPLPFSVQAPLARRRALRTIAAANHATPLSWRIGPDHAISVRGDLALARPLTPASIVAGAVSLLVPGEHHLELLVEILGEAECLNSRKAA